MHSGVIHRRSPHLVRNSLLKNPSSLPLYWILPVNHWLEAGATLIGGVSMIMNFYCGESAAKADEK